MSRVEVAYWNACQHSAKSEGKIEKGESNKKKSKKERMRNT